MRKTAIVWWLLGICLVGTLFESSIIALRLPAEQQTVNALRMLVWIVLSSLVGSLIAARAVKMSFWKILVSFATLECVLVLEICAAAWHVQPSPARGVDILFPVWMASSMSICTCLASNVFGTTGNADNRKEARVMVGACLAMSLTSCLVATYHLLHSLAQTSLATKLFLEFFIVVSGLSTQWTLQWALENRPKVAPPGSNA